MKKIGRGMWWAFSVAVVAGLLGVSMPLAQTLGEADLEKLALSARTAQDHAKLAAHYRAHAAEHEMDAKLHEELIVQLRKTPNDDEAWDLARDAAHYAEHSRDAAEALRDLAASHAGIAERMKAGS
jgi:hypothetical protein